MTLLPDSLADYAAVEAHATIETRAALVRDRLWHGWSCIDVTYGAAGAIIGVERVPPAEVVIVDGRPERRAVALCSAQPATRPRVEPGQPVQRYEFANIELTIGGVRFEGVKSIDYDEWETPTLAGVPLRVAGYSGALRVRLRPGIVKRPGEMVYASEIADSRYWRRRDEWARRRENRKARKR